MGRGIAVLLALSLAANVFLGGFVAGKVFSGRDGHGKSHVALRHHDAMDGLSEMTPAARESLKRAYMTYREGSRDRHEKTLALKSEFAAAIGADQFDRAAIEAIIEKLEAAEASGRSGMARLIVDAAEDLSLEDRKSLAKYLEKRNSRWKHHKGRMKDAGDDDQNKD